MVVTTSTVIVLMISGYLSINSLVQGAKRLKERNDKGKHETEKE